MTNAQAALEAASRIHQKVSEQMAADASRVTRTADHLLKWLRENDD